MPLLTRTGLQTFFKRQQALVNAIYRIYSLCTAGTGAGPDDSGSDCSSGSVFGPGSDFSSALACAAAQERAKVMTVAVAVEAATELAGTATATATAHTSSPGAPAPAFGLVSSRLEDMYYSAVGGGTRVGGGVGASAAAAGGRTTDNADGDHGAKRHRQADVYGPGPGNFAGPARDGATSTGAYRVLFRTREDGEADASASNDLSMLSSVATARAGYQPPAPVTTLGSIFAPSVDRLRRPTRAFAALTAINSSRKPAPRA